jgi:fatty-acyl-CoA synthase
VESVLLRHPDISEAAVLGVPDDVFGERIKACLIARGGARLVADDIRSYCAKHLSDYKVPELIEIWTEFPRNATGKILKTALKHQHPK